jgi:phosphatidate cytidylyltransferase
MLKHRLFYGILMIVFFAALVIFDGWLDGHMPTSISGDKPVQGTVLGILIVLIIISAQLEFSKLAAAKNLKIFLPFSIIASVLFAGSWYWGQLIEIPPLIYVFSVSAFSLFGLLLYQYFRYGTSDVMANCGANYFAIIYTGLLIAFVLGIRIDFGLWPLLMFVFVVKSSDIGAYVTGGMFGKHKFSPNISPGKTWEGMGGAVLTAVIAALLFAAGCDIMAWWSAVIFGFCFAFIGQGGDLVESMMKRDAKQKDSSNNVPGFGGILDVIDSPLLAAPFAYLFFIFAIGR